MHKYEAKNTIYCAEIKKNRNILCFGVDKTLPMYYTISTVKIGGVFCRTLSKSRFKK